MYEYINLQNLIGPQLDMSLKLIRSDKVSHDKLHSQFIMYVHIGKVVLLPDLSLEILSVG